MNVIAPAILLLALIAFALLLRRESSPARRRYWRQAIAISGLLLIGTVAHRIAFGAHAVDCGFDWTPSVHMAGR